MDKLTPAQGVGRHTFGGKKLHNDVIFPEFSALPGTIASTPAPSPVQVPETPEAPLPEPANHSSPGTDAPVTGQTSSPGTAAASGRPAASRARKGRLAAPPFSWLGGDAWPHFPAWADSQA